MKATNKIALLAGAAVAAIMLMCKNRSVDGIGATKRPVRRIWSEVESAQKAGIDLSDPNGWQNNAQLLRRMSDGKLSKSSSIKPVEQRYFEQLRRAYRSIAGTNLPYKESVVRNENDDVILIYRDYGLDKLPKIAADWIASEAESDMGNNPERAAYWTTIAGIANGTLKFVWNSKGQHRGVQELVFGASAPEERKKRISYLASPQKGGIYPEELAHRVWEHDYTDRADDMQILNGILEAIRDCNSVGQAQKMCKDEYLKAHQVEEPLLYQDVPF